MGHRLDDSKHQVTRLREQYDREAEELANKFREDMLEILRQGALDLFDDFPSMNSFGWHQSWEWNDEEYVFRMPKDEEHLTINEDWYDEFDKTLPGEIHVAASEILYFINSFNEEDFQKMIGMGFQVSISRNGVSIREF